MNRALAKGRVPIVSPISADRDGNSYNVNADSAAAALAVGAQCSDLIFFSDVPGVCVEGDRLDKINMQEARALIRQGVIQGGMIAKMDAAFSALGGGVPRVHVAQWQGQKTLRLLEESPGALGTTIVA